MTITLYLPGIGAMQVASCSFADPSRTSEDRQAKVLPMDTVWLSKENDEDSTALLRARYNGEVFREAIITFKGPKGCRCRIKSAVIMSFWTGKPGPDHKPAYEYFTMQFVQYLREEL